MGIEFYGLLQETRPMAQGWKESRVWSEGAEYVTAGEVIEW